MNAEPLLTERATPQTPGMVIHHAKGYDLLVRLLTLGRERTFRKRLLAPAHLKPGESVLDVGCGTGSLALGAKDIVGSWGEVHGVDPSPEMIARANQKARKARLIVQFKTGVAECLDYPDGRFDVVLSTVMLHHLPKAIRQQGVREMRRVLKPKGRLVAVDFVRSPGPHGGLRAHFHRHGRVDPRDLEALIADAGLDIVESAPVGKWDLQYVIGRRNERSS
jgi:ubiquinone/menaquinone biosynthesis C-methylase UbiE